MTTLILFLVSLFAVDMAQKKETPVHPKHITKMVHHHPYTVMTARNPI